MLLKKYELTYDTIYKSNNITMNFNEFDVDTSDFVVTVTRKGVQVDLKGSIATIAVIKPNNSVDAQFIDVIDTSKLYCDLKSNMKNLPGTYEAMIMISNNGEHISIGPVKYFVQDNKPFAQLDSSISDDTRLTIVQELLDKLQPIYDTELQRIANEEDRVKAEELRKSLEILRIDAEELRVNNENTRVQSESTRVASENVRIESENFRVLNENTRESNESTRVASEVSRASSEKIREDSEGDRLEAENTRQANEKNRVLNESQRQQNESDRVVNETQRVQNESNRQYFEEKRVEAELVRKQWYDKAFEGSEKMSVDEATRVENEAQRVNAETLRIQRESDRVTQETKREQQEVSRTSKENERLQAETTRQSNEGIRQSNENDRVAKESSRVQVEQSRVNAEKLRATNETTRVNSEQTRADNEKARVLAEQQRITEHQAREELLSGYDSRLTSIESVNETNTIRLNEMDRVNRNQAIAIQGLINEHSDKRISLTEDAHNINLDYATKGILEVDSIEGETLVNVSDQKDSVAISKAYNVEGTNHIALQGELDGKARPNIHGNTMVNVATQKELVPVTKKYDDIVGNEGKLVVGSVANKKGYVEVDKIVGNTLVNLIQRSWVTNNNYMKYIIVDNLKVNTDYTLIAPATSTNRFGVFDSTGAIALNPYSSDIIITFNTGSRSSIRIYITAYNEDGSTNSSGTINVDYTKTILLEGDYTNKPIPSEVFEGLQSSFESNLITQEMIEQGLESVENLGKYKVPVKLIGKNLLPPFTLGNVNVVDNGVSITANSIKGTPTKGDFNVSYYIYFKKGSYITSCKTRIGDNSRIRLRDAITKEIIRSNIVNSFTITESKVYIISFENNGNTSTNFEFTDVQIEEGTVTTDREEYFERTTNVYLNSPLLENDEIVMHDGELCHYHKGLIDIWTGDESWGLGTTFEGNKFATSIKPYNESIDVLVGGGTLKIEVCDKLKIDNPYMDNLNCVWIYRGSENGNVERRLALDGTQTTVDDYKNWLKENNLKIYYPLQNPYYEPIQADKLILECANDSTLHIESIVPVKSISFKAYEEELKYLHTSKDYKVKFESDAIGTCDITLGGTKLVSQSIKVGINEFSITTPATLTDNKLVIEGEGFNIERVSVVDTVLDFDYFEGMYSCFENQLVTDEADPNFGKYKVEYKVTGKNKCPVSSYSRQATKWGDTLVQLDSVVYKNIKISPTSKYIVSVNDSTDTLKVIAHYTPLPENVTTHSGAYTRAIKEGGIEQKCGLVITGYNYISLTTGGYYSISKIPENTLVEYTNIQIEEGTVATTYESYKEYIKTFYLNSPLLKGDTIEEINGKTTHVRRYKQDVFDGSKDEGWNVSSVIENRYYKPINGKEIHITEKNMICDKINVITAKESDAETLGIAIANGNKLMANTEYETLDEWKAELQINPITVVYELATPIYETISEDNRIIDSYVNGHLDLDSSVPVEKVDFRAWEGKLRYLYPSTTYTVQFVSDIDTKVNITLGGSLLSSQLATKGLNSFTIQTPATIDANEVKVDGIGANISKVLVTNSTREFNYFEGLKSSFEDNVTEEGKYKVPVKLIGKNLFDKSKVKFVGIDTTNGLEVDNGYYSSDFIKIKPNTSYIRSQGSGIYYYDNDKKFILFQSHRVKSPTNAFYCRIQLQKDWNLDTVQIEEGTVATSYEKYYEYNASVLLNSPLLKGDELIMKDGELCHYHKRDKCILDGSNDEDIRYFNNTIIEKENTVDFYLPHNTQLKNSIIICDNFTTVNDTFRNDTECCSGKGGTGYNLWFSILRSELSTLDVLGFRQWLQANPTTVIYELAEPWYEPIQIGKIMLECINNSIFTIDTDLPVKSSINYSASIPSVQAMSNDINSLQDTSVDIITSSWDTDYRLSEVEWVLEDNGLLSPMMFNLEAKSTRGGTSMAFTKFEQAKIMILAGAYDREVLTKQLQRYLEKGVITKTEYEDLIALMDANELVAGK